MYTVTIKSLSKENEIKARWLENDIECWLNKYKDEWEAMENKTTWFSAEKALSFGLVDKIE